MVYTMKIYVDGGCRGNGKPGSIGAAAAVLTNRWGRSKISTRKLSFYPQPTNQRAEITAIILALEVALQRYEKLHSCPKLKLTIYSDSKYAVGCMTEWVDGWLQNGWKNSRGVEVVNRDLIEEANDLDGRLRDLGKLKYKWIPRGENTVADKACNDCMDEM
jgi:ribonuclease HI